MALTFKELLSRVSASEFLAKGLAVATALLLPVTSWQPGDPSRAQFHFISEMLELLEDVVAPYVGAAVLDYAEEPWLTLVAKQGFNVDVPEATYATTTLTLSNAGGGEYTIEPGDLTFKNSTTGKTYHNTSGGTLASGPSTTLDVTIEADEAGSDSNASALEIDELITTLLGVSCANASAAVGTDKPSAESIRELCREASGALSPNGPRDAYTYVAKNQTLTGSTNVTRARSIGDSDTGDVTLYIASPSGAVSAADRQAVEDAVLLWATPLTITPTVIIATAKIVAVEYQLWLYNSVGKTTAEVAAEVSTVLQKMAVGRPIGGDVIPPASGKLHHSLISSTIKSAFPDHTFRVAVTSPASDVDLLASEVPVIGTLTPTIYFVQDP